MPQGAVGVFTLPKDWAITQRVAAKAVTDIDTYVASRGLYVWQYSNVFSLICAGNQHSSLVICTTCSSFASCAKGYSVLLFVLQRDLDCYGADGLW